MIKEIIGKVMDAVPDNISPVERQTAIGERLAELPHTERYILRQEVEKALVRMKELGASDIDLGGHGCSKRVWYRVEGVKKPDVHSGEFSVDETDVLCQNLLTDSQRRFLYENRNLDFSYQVEHNGSRLRFRADLYFELHNLALNMRFIDNSIRPLKDLGLHPKTLRTLSLLTEKFGLTLVTGITGSGKSTTLDSIIDANNKTVEAHIVIIASPVETVHESIRCIVRHREVGSDVLSFKTGAVQALRQDPDIIVIGEMRDPDTIMTALEITDSGHKVFSTLHTASAVESIDRIIGECPVQEKDRVRNRLADTLRCVISQKLIPTTCGKRVLAKEVMVMTPSVKAAIKNNNTSEIYQMITEGKTEGMHTMEQDLLRLVHENKITRNDAENYANNKNRMKELLGVN